MYLLSVPRTSVDMDGTLKFVNHKVGGLKTPISFIESKKKYFFLWNYFVMQMLMQPEGRTQFYTFFSELRVIVFLSSTQSSRNLKFIKKMAMFEQLKNQVLVNSKNFLTPH